MSKDDYQELVNMNYRALTLLGIATAIISEHVFNQPEKCEWFLQAINDVVYLNKPLPPMPERKR